MGDGRFGRSGGWASDGAGSGATDADALAAELGAALALELGARGVPDDGGADVTGWPPEASGINAMRIATPASAAQPLNLESAFICCWVS